MNKIQDQFGDPSEFLCSDCYETVSAKEWNNIENILIEKHIYDHNI